MAKRRSKDDILRVEMMGDHEIPFYRIETSDGLVVEVPKYVRRIFSKRNGKVNVKGWQIAYVRMDVDPFNPFFSDGDSGPYISLEKATDELRRFLSRTPNTKQSGLRLNETKQDLYRTGLSGVRLDWRFGRRNALYELKVEARAGVYTPSRTKVFYVGTEFSVTRERLERALVEARKFRDEQISLAAEKGQTFTNLLQKRDIQMTSNRAFEVLEHLKARNIDYLDSVAVERAERWMSEKRLYMTFRNHRFYADRRTVLGLSVKVPEFIWLEGKEWQFEFELPNGTLHQDFIPLSKDPKSDIIRAMADCFLESMLVSLPIRGEALENSYKTKAS